MGEVFWTAVQRLRKISFLIGIICFSAQVYIWLNLEDGIAVHFIEAALKAINLWSWILTIFGFASLLLNEKSPHLSYANRAVYPFYILHQTITVLLGYFISQLDWGLLPKALILVLGTFGSCFIIYEYLIRRIKWFHVLFGVKSK